MGTAQRPRHPLVKTCRSLFLATAFVGLAPAALASSLPSFDSDPRPVIGFGIGPSLSFDWRATDLFSLGASAGVSVFEGPSFRIDPATFGIIRYDLRGLYRLRDGGPAGVTVSALGGIWGDTAFLRQPIEGFPAGIEGGFALSYPFLPQLVGRINFLVSYQFFASPLGFNVGYFPPSAGLEFAYFPLPGLEVTLGYNGQGDIIGLRWRL